jgi:hypothetical protein
VIRTVALNFVAWSYEARANESQEDEAANSDACHINVELSSHFKLDLVHH